MRWPNNTAYTEAVRDYPHISIQDPELKGGKSKRGKDGFLVSYAGGFSIVFPIVTGSNTFALRCWTQDVKNAEVRYKEVSVYLKRVRLPYFVDFEYVPTGILVSGTRYPITRMKWADGVSLRDFISHNSQRPHLFKVVADEFQKMIAALHRHQIAHGDLQDGNILLKRNGNNVEIKLIDYDSLFVPALRGQFDSIVGLPEYQHPIRMADIGRAQVSENVDYFSELVIYLSFLALSEMPQLWDQFKDKTERGLLFSEKDFENPSRSPIFHELANLSPDVQQLASTLKDFCARTSIDQLKSLEAILPKSDANSHTDRGFFFFNDKRYDKALAEYKKALNLNSRYERAHRGIGLVYLHTKLYADAINAFQQAIQLNSNYTEAHHGLALAYFRSGDNSKATAAANAALKIDPYYQPARLLVDVIKSSISTPISPSSTTKSKLTAKPHSTVSTTRSSPIKPRRTPSSRTTNRTSRRAASQSVRTNPVTNLWQYITDALGNSRPPATAGVLGLALVVCLIAFLIRTDRKDEFRSQNTTLKRQFAQKETEIRGLTSSVQTLESEKNDLTLENGKLQDDLEHFRALSGGTFRDVIDLRKQLTEEEEKLTEEEEKSQRLRNQLDGKNREIQQLQNDKEAVINENRRLQDQLAESNPENTDRNTTLQQLRNEKVKALEENRALRNQLAAKASESEDLTTRVQQLQNKKAETQRQNRKLQNENSNLTRQNQKLREENIALRDQLQELKQGNLKISPEAPKKTQDYRNVVTRAGVYNNHGVIAFDRGEYKKAIAHFTAAIKTDSKFEMAHYNLGCTYLQTKEYRYAISAFNKTVSLNQKFKEAYYNRGFAYFMTRQLQKAKQDATKAIDINSNYQQARELWKAIDKVH